MLLEGLEGEAAAGLYMAVLATLRHRSQRNYAIEYLHGLLTAEGRKTISKIAAGTDRKGSAQALHHFISDSPWDWNLVRRSVARFLDDRVQPRAWVVAPLLIPKSGPHSVGVSSMFVPDVGSQVSAQRAYGLWLANEGASYPVNWRIHLPQPWLEEPRRGQVGIPTEAAPSTQANCVTQAVLDTASWGLAHRPVVIDARQTDPREIVTALGDADIPVLLKVSCSTLVQPQHGEHEESPGAPVPVLRLAAALRQQRRHVTWRDPRSGALSSSLAATARVRLPGGPADQDLVVLYEWRSTRGRPSGFWITSMTDQTSEQLVRWGRLALQVSADVQKTGTDVGLRDFEGRTYRGWHHHMTLASAAHSALKLASATQTVAAPSRSPDQKWAAVS
ncbi:IS701 family transposase [Streptomyces luteolus]|uniref:Transposase n=1 Tax=Streptomyces luteolus TaxID=3043615 RepID=A0ABT6T391_9ACTN|nr:transposase [Streptomyces sp. B-S-A12]MDI3422105.1 transposase [Streptomyces sp. B-S-A12]